MKKIISKTLIFLIMLSMICTTAFALAKYDDESYVIDQADVLTSEEETSLETAVANFISDNKLDFKILLVNDSEFTSPQSDCEDFYITRGMGLGDRDDGILFYLNFATRDFRMIGKGLGADIYSSYEISKITDSFIDYISNEDYYQGISIFIQEADKYATLYVEDMNKAASANTNQNNDYNNEISSDTYNYQGEEQESFFSLKKELILLGIGLLLSTIILLGLRSSMNTAIEATYAGDYIVPGSFKLYRETDTYLYSNTSRRKKPKAQNSSSSGSGGGGSSSSGGFSGGGSKF